MKDSLHQALQRIDQLKHEVDSLKNIQQPKIDLLNQRLELASDTVNSLGTMATGWGTVYAAVSIVVVILTIALPWWLTNRADKTILRTSAEYDEKIKAIGSDTKNLANLFVEKQNQLKDIYKEQIENLEEKYNSDTKDLQNKVERQFFRLEANIWSSRASVHEDAGRFGHATGCSLGAAIITFGYNPNSDSILANLDISLRNFELMDIKDLPKLDDLLTRFPYQLGFAESIEELKIEANESEVFSVVKILDKIMVIYNTKTKQ